MSNVKSFHLTPKIILLSLITFAIFSGVVYGQAQVRENVAELINRKAARNINDFILDKLQANRIVMLADAGHGNPLYMQTVIAALNHWVTRIEQQPEMNHSQKLPAKLYLILELDSLQVNKLKQYFATGNLLDVIQSMNFVGCQFTTGTLEFYEDLRILKNRIDKLSIQRRKDQIQFEIFGPEKLIDLDQWSFEKRDHFFIYERDEYSSAKIIDLLDKEPDAKALIFYGAVHLNTVQTRKQAGNQQGMGYFIGYYLTEHFRDKGGVYIFDRVLLMPGAGWLDEAYQKPGISYAIDNSIFDGIAIPVKMQPQPADGSIFHFAKVTEPKHIGSVWTENFVERIFRDIDRYKDVENDYHKMILGSRFHYLSIIAGKEPEQLDYNNAAVVEEAIRIWKRWHESAKLDIVRDIESLTFWKRIIDWIGASQDPQAVRYEMLLGNMLGYKVWFHAGAPPQQRAESYWRYLNQYRKPIVIENLIPLLWVGSDAEKQKVRTILERESSRKFKTAKEWLSWWHGLKPQS
ncbi:hypothetical protein L0337_24145 [candidate division KSB1 bacterium]|nr:hypothetical protein [candidate division KSB1 bacterium]